MITITIRKAKKVNGENSAFISFPYDIEMVNIMRQQPQKYWHPDYKEWELPTINLDRFIAAINGRKYRIEGKGLLEAKPAKIPENFSFTTKPYKHQIEGLQYGMQHEKFLLGDEQGLGKTKQVIDIAVAKKLLNGYKHCLIICGVNGLKWNWQAEIKTHSKESGYILGGKKGSSKDKLNDLNNLPNDYFLITNIESLREQTICDKIAELCKNGTIGMIAVDEVHKCKNPSSQQTKGLLKLKPKTRIAMTGTPLMNSPLDLFVVLKWLGFENHSFYQFRNRYCVMGGYGNYEVVGYKNLGELQAAFNSITLRRLKKEVLDLPEKVYTTEYVEMNRKQASIYNEVMAEIRLNIDKIKMSNNPLAQLIRLRQATGYTGILSNQIAESAKLDRLEELVEDIAEAGGKCVIFSNWTDVTTPAYKRLKRFYPAIITGETKDREAEQNRFMNDDRCKCIIGTIGAMGTGLTLTAASTVIFLDSPWNRANKEQAEDRVHRIGTKSIVNIITLVCKNTIDERIEEIIYQKGQMADMLVDGNITNANKAEIVDFLLN